MSTPGSPAVSRTGIAPVTDPLPTSVQKGVLVALAVNIVVAIVVSTQVVYNPLVAVVFVAIACSALATMVIYAIVFSNKVRRIQAAVIEASGIEVPYSALVCQKRGEETTFNVDGRRYRLDAAVTGDGSSEVLIVDEGAARTEMAS